MTDPASAERTYFDRFVSAQGDFNPFTDRGWNVLARRFRELAAPPAGADLLDVGCGTGRSRQVYAGTFGRYTGVDLSPAAIEAARANFPADSWEVADANHLPFPEASFDVVAFSSVLHHIPDYAPAVREAYRVLRPGGRAFAYDPNLLHPGMAALRHPRSPLYLSEGVSPNERPLAPSALRRAFEAAGFPAVGQQCQSGIPYRQVAPKGVNAVLGAFNAADLMWERVGLGRVFGMFVLTYANKPMSEVPRS